ncbi:phage head-tail joining protein [Paenirhodobacter enshiensis]|uniref:Uncharacterized protein n=1 Tax=Paenirhodobacter enshiensis TaxID=1105367 RepID=A0A086XQQ8_9RHOB|nr:hypothetical protein [Paenirhodobacter enshiensis]KFI24358.1 hypothetical protein CG50_10680 [Paenirhodobacter enshiensis]
MAYTQAHLDLIKESYASGVTSVSYDGKTTTYRSLAEMKQIIATIEGELSSTSGRSRPVAGFATFRRS